MNRRTGLALSLCVVTGLSGCGGGSTEDTQSVSDVQVRTLRYGFTADIRFAGAGLRADMVASSTACKDARFRADSTPQSVVLNCTIIAAGAHPLTLTGSRGQLLYQTTLNVPQPQVTLETSKGSVVLELTPAAVPGTVNNFLGYVNRGYYTNTIFHRVISGFVAQGGGYTTGLVKKAGQGAPIVLETNKGLSNLRATVAMARTLAPDTAITEFYVNLVDNLDLDYRSAEAPGYAVFGKVVQGMEVIDAIAKEPTTTFNGVQNVPVTDILLLSAVQTQ